MQHLNRTAQRAFICMGVLLIVALIVSGVW